MDRDQITMGNLGLKFSSSTVNVTNTFIIGTTAAQSANLIEVTGGSGNFQFNTVAYNVISTPSTLVMNCTNGASMQVKNSIFMQNGVQQQLGPSCRVSANSLVLGQGSKGPAGQIAQDAVFVDPANGDLHLKPFDPTNSQYLIDKAVEVKTTDKNIDHDYYGTPRPQGDGYDIGAAEVPIP
jgi:hypothetical protein